MFDEKARIFLQKKLIARLSTIDKQGYPHLVPIWFMLDREDIVFISDRNTRKAQNAAANPKAAVTIGGDIIDEAGYMIQGDILVEPDDGHLITHRMIDKYSEKEEGDQLKEAWKNDDIVVLRLKPKVLIKVR